VSRRFQKIDVFGSGPLSGNPLAVVVDAEGLNTGEMERITRWMNLSETAFLLPPSSSEADYRVRIFTLVGELPFAGHPTLGSCHTWLTTGGEPRSEVVVQECGAGLIPVRRDANRLAFAAPKLVRSGPVESDYVDQMSDVLGIGSNDVVDSRWVDNGPGWVGLLLDSSDAVLGVNPDFGKFDGENKLEIGVVGPYPPGGECSYEVRAFFTNDQGGMTEDPVTGSLNASVAQWMLETGRVKAPFVASQGTRLGRAGRVFIDQDAEDTVWVGGATITVVNGTIDL